MLSDEEKELNQIANEIEGQIANAAADMNLVVLATLGALDQKVTLEYRMTVAKALVYVLMALASVRYCIEEATGEMNHGQRLAFVARVVSRAFAIDPDPLIVELLAEARAA